MKPHYRNYCIHVNGKSLNYHVSIEAVSDDHIKNAMEYHKKKVIANGEAGENDKITFKFKYSHTDK